MATKFNTKPGEEQFINTVIKNGFKFELPKYIMLRLAINISFRLPYYSLDNKIWSDSISYSGENAKGAEYNYEQVTGLGKEKDYTNVLRAMFAWRHRDENIDFSDDAHFEKTVEKYIHRGLLEINNTYKASDDFYQWLIDNLKLSGLDEKPSLTSQQNLNTSLQEDLLHYFKKENLSIEILDYRDAIRHDVCKIHIKEQKDYKTLNKSISTFKNEFGLYGEADLCEVVGEKMNFLLYLPRAKNEWKNFGFDEFKADLDKVNKAEIEVYCGRTLYNEPYFFDLNDCPHLLVAGTTGSGKSVLLNTIIASIEKLNKNTEFVLIDPKNGAEFGFYEKTRILSDITQNKVIKDIEKRRYKDYKFIRDSINISTSPKDIYYVLLRKAVSYIDFIEDGYNPDLQFPVYILSKFELNSWFKRNFETYYTEEMIITLINKLFNSIYRSIFV